jgi:hypothetical protein
MGERLPRVTGKEVVSALQRLGFELHHVRGSHHLRNPLISSIEPEPVPEPVPDPGGGQ